MAHQYLDYVRHLLQPILHGQVDDWQRSGRGKQVFSPRLIRQAQ